MTAQDRTDAAALDAGPDDGATEKTVIASCPCGWFLQRERSEVRP